VKTPLTSWNANLSKCFVICLKRKSIRIIGSNKGKIRASVKKFDPDHLVMLFEGAQSKDRGFLSNGTIEAK